MSGTRHYLGVTARGARFGVQIADHTAGGEHRLPVGVLSTADAVPPLDAGRPQLWPVPADLYEQFRPRGGAETGPTS